MAQKFKVGDRVRVVGMPCLGIRCDRMMNDELVIKTALNNNYTLDGEDCHHNCCYFPAGSLQLISPATPKQYRGELREGMRVWLEDTDKFTGGDFSGERSVYKEGGRWTLRGESGQQQKMRRRSNGEWWSPAGIFYISHVISEPEPNKELKLKKVTNLIKGLSQPLKNYMRLGWVEIEGNDYKVTADGSDALLRQSFGLTGAKDLPEYAAKEAARLKKEAKKENDEE